MIYLCMGWERVVCGGREKMFGYRNKNKTKVGFCLVYGAILGTMTGGSGLKHSIGGFVCISDVITGINATVKETVI